MKSLAEGGHSGFVYVGESLDAVEVQPEGYGLGLRAPDVCEGCLDAAYLDRRRLLSHTSESRLRMNSPTSLLRKVPRTCH